MNQEYSPEERFDYFFIIIGAILGILGGFLIGVPLWLATGVFNYVRLFTFLGITIGGIIGTAVTSKKQVRRRKRN
jgi:hypothetical protein